MIKKIRIKFIALTTGVLLSLLLAILITINSFMAYQTNRKIDEFLNTVLANNGKMMVIPNRRQHPLNQPELPDRGTFPPAPNVPVKGFSIQFDTEGNVYPISLNELDLTEDQAKAYAEEAYKKGDLEGKFDSYRYKMKKMDKGTLIVFADQATQDLMLIELQNLSFITGSISMVVLVIITILLSKFIVKPVNIAFEKQKRFVADSSHELKTPLAIISANIDILKMETGDNQYVREIKNQSKRMNHLIRELLLLARTENQNTQDNFVEFNLSDAIENTVLPFEVLAFEQGKELILDVEEDIQYRGDENNIKKMLSALIDNGVKYSMENSQVKISLQTKGNKNIIQIQNHFDGNLPKESEKLFDRFYRTDESRARETGGYGIGLSIVKNIVEQHRGKVYIETTSSNVVKFRMVL